MTARTILSPELIESRSVRVPESGCWIWMGACHERGYGNVTVSGRCEKAHRLSWQIFRGEIGPMHVLHRCDVPACVNPAHLFLGTHQDSMRDREAKGRNRMPPSTLRARRLTEENVREIFAARGIEGAPVLAEKFGVKVYAIYKIWSGVRWRHLCLS